MDDLNTTPANLTVSERQEVADTMATCPFIGAAVASGLLEVLNTRTEPLASIATVVALGDSGGGDLGRNVLRLFARGNHSFRLPLAENERDNALVPGGTFNLQFGGSQGAHPGHSGILLADPEHVGVGALDQVQFQRLVQHADASGRLSIDAMGDFIAENLRADPGARVFPVVTVLKDGIRLLREYGDVLFGGGENEKTEAFAALTRLLGADNLMGSAGEWGLLFAFLRNSPNSDNGDIALSDVELMFVQKQLPADWETWKKTSGDWIRATLRLTKDASLAYHFGR